jgi:hypothetical protein
VAAGPQAVTSKAAKRRVRADKRMVFPLCLMGMRRPRAAQGSERTGCYNPF